MDNSWAWMEQSACKHSDPTLFDNDEDDEYPPEEVKRICVSCPVRGKCLSLHKYDNYGIWGGMTRNQRDVLRSEHTQVVCPACAGRLIARRGKEEICLGCGISWVYYVNKVKL
jgi:hypothetical protein